MTNWYKKYIFSSWNLKFPENIYPQVDNIVENIVNFYQNFNDIPSSPLNIGTVSFVNPYNNKNVISNIYINNKKVIDDGGTIAKRDRVNGNVYFNIFGNLLFKEPTEIELSSLRNFSRQHLIHELSHSIDPKIVNLNKVYDYSEYLKPTEFDAYSKEITEYIKRAYSFPENKNILKEWIIGVNFGGIDDTIKAILKMPEPIFYIIQYWRDNSPEFYRKLRQRLYNEVLNESSN